MSEPTEHPDIVVGQAIEVLAEEHQPGGLAVAPAVTADDLVARLAVIREAAQKAMLPDVDFGVIPGTGSKPTLLKPGAEKLAVLFQLDVQIESEKVFDGNHLTVMSRATVYHAPTGNRLGMGEGMCSTKESKYAYREAQRLCPDCGQPQVRKGKPRDGRPGNWYCWKKFGGCGVTWALDSEQGVVFDKMETGRIDNPDLPEQWNTVLKMSEKRARIDAVLAVTGASALFTQDMEKEENAGEETVVRSDGHEPASGAKSWKEWEARMTAREVPRPMDWLKNAAEASGLAETKDKAWGKSLSQKANRVLLILSEREPASPVGFWSVPEVQGAFSEAFDGVVVEPPSEVVDPSPEIEFSEPSV